jgi:hypothetical protein
MLTTPLLIVLIGPLLASMNTFKLLKILVPIHFFHHDIYMFCHTM